MSLHRLVVVVAALSAIAVGAALLPPPPRPSSNCQRTCGGVNIPYPFGIEADDSPDHCSLPGFNLSCKDDGHGVLRPFYYNVEVLNISLQGRARMRAHMSTYCYNTSTKDMMRNNMALNLTGTPYRFSDTGNLFTVVGCRTLAYIGDEDNVGKYMSGCVSMCRRGDVSALANGSCVGIGCCTTAIPKGLQYYKVWFDPGLNTLEIYNTSRCSYAVLLEESSFRFLTSYATSSAFFDAYGGRPPLLVDWAIGNETCQEAKQKPGSYACVADSSECFDSANGPGYICNCSKEFQGNPYLVDGCKDIDECAHPHRHSCYGDCINMYGTFQCLCKHGTYGNPFKQGGCSSLTVLQIGLPVSGAIVFLLLAIGAPFVTRKIKMHKVKKRKERFFKLNHGLLLQQLESQKSDIGARMIITLGELEKATNNFDPSHKVGGGGHGIVYKGLLDLQVVAIKKSKIIIQKEIEDFINEVAILSQINHRNIVKLLGCCLETEVPLLVYEFISNGTLAHHLHVEGNISLPWDDRMRIALESSKALAYLHSAASIQILHRDIKSSNILLDDNLIAKVSDFGASRYISIDQTGVTTAIQGTFGYLDPTYCYTSRLTDKSDVFSFGVLLIELLTRKRPTVLTSDGDSLVSHFASLVAERDLVDIIDPQIMEEAEGEKVEEVAKLAAMCTKLNGEDRPTMREVEMTLESLLVKKRQVQYNGTPMRNGGDEATKHYMAIGRDHSEASRQYTMEEEILLSASYPR